MIKIERFGQRRICIGGVGKLFYQEGFPISISVEKLKEAGYEVSMFHIADECLKNGWTPKTTFKKLKIEIEDDINNVINCNLEELEKFCYAEYEDQREMIFNFLYASREEALEIMRHRMASNFVKDVLFGTNESGFTIVEEEEEEE
jgi:hypothetical protein